MSETIDLIVERYRNAYAFYVFADDLVVVKYPKKEKYFIRDGCSCPGYLKWSSCKHLKMFSGIWTPGDGNPDWVDNELSDFLIIPELPDAFSTAIINGIFDFGYPLVCFTVKHGKHSMGS